MKLQIDVGMSPESGGATRAMRGRTPKLPLAFQLMVDKANDLSIREHHPHPNVLVKRDVI